MTCYVYSYFLISVYEFFIFLQLACITFENKQTEEAGREQKLNNISRFTEALHLNIPSIPQSFVLLKVGVTQS